MKHICLLFVALLANSFLSNTVKGLREESIIGGQLAKEKQFKYVVAVMYKPQEGNLVDQNPCTGSIIANMFISTVAHCFYEDNTGMYRNKEYYISISLTDIYNPVISTTDIRVDLVIIPKIYDPLVSNPYASIGNLAIVKLTQGLGLRAGHIYYKKLVVAKDIVKNLFKNYTVAGFGWNKIKTSVYEENGSIYRVQKGSSDGKLRYATVKALDDFDCTSKINSNIAPGNMCFQMIQSPDKLKGICEGDSGSPVVHGRYLTGIAIQGSPDCKENTIPGIYINTALYNEFISDAIRDLRNKDMLVLRSVKINETFKFIEV